QTTSKVSGKGKPCPAQRHVSKAGNAGVVPAGFRTRPGACAEATASEDAARTRSRGRPRYTARNELSITPVFRNLSGLMQKVNLGMIGGGTVGSGVFHAWQLNGRLMADRLGVALDFRRIAVKDLDEPRPYPIPRSLMTTNWQEVVNDPQVQVVIELVGGT